ncbi:accessory gene regulator ArgB-like protein [Halonatronum saccharophilum]|uniref:accessory gene regulator ArgB-like protein n=1 Tax=Halonatronum saccharophilum TaxID=150060 RepID=UPI0004814102|nr:accessory gene regulator B family protein [Halonatronum saccharophilum]
MLKLSLEKISVRIINNLFDDFSKEKKEIMVFGLLAIFSTLIAYSLIIIFSSLFGVLLFSLVGAVSFSILRVFSGGVHALTFKGCILSSVITFILIGLKTDYLMAFLGVRELSILFWFVFILASVIIYLYVPAQVEENLIEDELKRSKLRISSFLVLFCLLSFYFSLTLLDSLQGVVLAGLLGILWQLFTLTPLAYKLYRRKYIRG